MPGSYELPHIASDEWMSILYTSVLRRRHKSGNVVKFCSFDMTLLYKLNIIQVERSKKI